MRQAGVLGTAARYALIYRGDRLIEDHTNAKQTFGRMTSTSARSAG